MAFDPGAIDSTLAAAIGNDAALIAELRGAFVESAARTFGVLEASADVVAWTTAAARLKGLSASFGAVRLMALADDAAAAPVGDAAVLKKIRRAIERL